MKLMGRSMCDFSMMVGVSYLMILSLTPSLLNPSVLTTRAAPRPTITRSHIKRSELTGTHRYFLNLPATKATEKKLRMPIISWCQALGSASSFIRGRNTITAKTAAADKPIIANCQYLNQTFDLINMTLYITAE